jgi:hypothetical protein
MPGYFSLQGISDPQIVRKTALGWKSITWPADRKPVRNFESFESYKLQVRASEKGYRFLIHYTVLFIYSLFSSLFPGHPALTGLFNESRGNYPH